MRFVKLVALGLGAALVSLTAMSNAGESPNLTGLKAESGTIVAGEFLSFSVQGSGECTIQVKVIEPTGKEYVDDYYSSFPKKLPTPVSSRRYMPGVHTLVVTTIADADTPNCPAGQTVSAKFEVLKEPRCPSGWDRTYFDVHTGAITCVPFDPTWDVECKGKTQPFFDSTNNVCQAGCQNVVY